MEIVIMSPEKTRQSNEAPHQAIQRERRVTKQKLKFPASVLSQAKVAMAHELISSGAYDGFSGDRIIKVIAADSRFVNDVGLA